MPIVQSDLSIFFAPPAHPGQHPPPRQHHHFAPHDEVEEQCVRSRFRTLEQQVRLGWPKKALNAWRSTTSSLRRSSRPPRWSRCDRAGFDVYLGPKDLDEKVAELHFPTPRGGTHSSAGHVFTQEQPDYIGIKVEVPFKVEHHRY